jgi:hypothetical protein
MLRHAKLAPDGLHIWNLNGRDAHAAGPASLSVGGGLVHALDQFLAKLAHVYVASADLADKTARLTTRSSWLRFEP